MHLETLKQGKSAAIVFIHGILSSGEACWTNATGASWPAELSKDALFKDIGIYSFTYQTNVFSGSYSLDDAVDALAVELRLGGLLQSHRLFFVCHSMGGIVARRFLVKHQHALITQGTQIGLFLIASPSLGSQYASWLKPIAQFFGHSQAAALRFSKSNDWLSALDKDFIDLKEKGQLVLAGRELVEDRFLVYRKWGLLPVVVERFSGARYFGDSFKVPGSDHFSIAKPNKGDIQYRLLQDFIGYSFAYLPRSPLGRFVETSDEETPDQKASDKETPNTKQQHTKLLYCSFCGKSQHEVKKLIAGPSVFICDECSDVCLDVLSESDLPERAKQVAMLCELTLVASDSSQSPSARQQNQDEIRQLVTAIRSRRAERAGDDVAQARLAAVVGSGSFATVWEAFELRNDEPTENKLAVKIFDQNKLGQGLMLWRFQRGIRAMKHLAGLNDFAPPSIVKIHAVAEDLLSFSMQYLPGGDLERIKILGWSKEKKLLAFRQVLAAVAFSHSQGIVHRDIKPANVVLDSEQNAVLTDFDIADLHFARTQSVYAGSLGTPQFAAPEQLIPGVEQASPTADIYSLGKLLYFMIRELAPPFGSTDADYIPSYLAEIDDESVRRTIHRAIRHNPNERFLTVQQFEEELFNRQ